MTTVVASSTTPPTQRGVIPLTSKGPTTSATKTTSSPDDTTASHTGRRRWELPARSTFAVMSTALVLVFLSAGTPIPLYNTYRAQDGLTNGDLSLVTAAYLGAAAVSLLVLGRLSDHLGRRPVALAALASSALGLLVLQDVHGVAALAGGRLLQGLATGLASSALGAYVVDAAQDRAPWLPATVTSAAPMLGIPLGALLSGALVDTAPAPRHLVFAVALVLLVLSAALVAISPETTPITTAREAVTSLRPRVLVPTGALRPALAMLSLVLAVWSMGGFYQAFGPSIAREELGSDAAFTAAAVFASFTLLGIAGGPLTARMRPDLALRIGAVAYAACVAGVVVTLSAGAIGPFLAISFIGGLTQGAATTGGMRALLGQAAPGDRAGLLSTIYLANYTSAAAPALLAGELTAGLDLEQIAVGYSLLVALGVVGVLLLARPPQPAEALRGAGTTR